MKEVCILGLGYIGLPTAAMFASNGVRVKGVDVKSDVCESINKGQIHIQEPGLEEIVERAVRSGMLSASTLVEPCENFIIAVPTPITSDKKADLSFVISAAKCIAPFLRTGNLVILESTVSPRCTLDVLIPELEKSGLKAGADFKVAHCPERVIPGQILNELANNNRIIGGIDEASSAMAKQLYSVFVKGEMIMTDATTAEMCKLVENTYRDVNIALANELSAICENLGVNVWELIKYANKHPRVHIHQPGPGVGGHCIAVDPWFIVESAPDIAKLISSARRINDDMPSRVLGRIRQVVPDLGKVVFLGCTYKQDVDDIRESPILHLVKLATVQGYEVVVVDPHVRQYDLDIYSALAGADMCVLAVHHSEFKQLDFPQMHDVMRAPNLLDTRAFLDCEKARAAGINYFLLGAADETAACRELR